MIYLIGGPARCGKSTLARHMRGSVNGQIIAGDAVVHALQAILTPEVLPAIYDHVVANVVKLENTEAKVDRLRRRDEAMWRFYSAFCDTMAFDAPKDDVLIEGSLWPDFLEGFSHSHKAVFLVDTSDEAQYERIVKIRDDPTSDNNWMRDYDDERMKQWVKFNIVRSQHYIDQCQRYGYPYFDIADHGIEVAEEKALAYLQGNAV